MENELLAYIVNNLKPNEPWTSAEDVAYEILQIVGLKTEEKIKYPDEKKLEVKHMDFGDDDPNYDANMMEVKGN